MAFVVLHEGAEADEAALIAHAHAHLAGYKAPKTVRFVEFDPAEPGRQAAAPGASRALLGGQGEADMSVARRTRRPGRHRRPSTGPNAATRSIRRPRWRCARRFDAFEADEKRRGRGAHRRRRPFLRRLRPQAVAETAPDYEPHGDGPMGPTRRLPPSRCIAAVEGYAVAGGLELALWCDLRVASATAVFGVFCRRWGVPLIDGGTVRLPRHRRPGPRARHDPHRPGGRRRGGLAFGLANRLVPAGEALRRGASAGCRDRPLSRRSACAPTAPRPTPMGPGPRGGAARRGDGRGQPPATWRTGRRKAFCRRARQGGQFW